MLPQFTRQLSNISAMHRQIYFSGIQPTGIPHLGNYFGLIEPWIELQKTLPLTTKMILSIVNQHAISVGPKPAEQMKSDTRRMVVGLLACGVDPSRTLLFRQSDVPQVTQLSWILGSLQTVTKLQRLPQYKEKAGRFKKGEVPVGLLTYPLLQAADVLLYKATHVPVGADQSQHMNLLADLAHHFNMKFGTAYFPIPNQITRTVAARIRSLRQPLKKMSKSEPSDKSRIGISDSKDEIRTKCRKAVSDNDGLVKYEPEKRPAVSNLVDLYCAVTGYMPAIVDELGWDTMRLKDELANAVENKFGPIRDEFKRIENSSEVDDVIFENGKIARKLAEQNMEDILRIVGFLS